MVSWPWFIGTRRLNTGTTNPSAGPSHRMHVYFPDLTLSAFSLALPCVTVFLCVRVCKQKAKKKETTTVFLL